MVGKISTITVFATIIVLFALPMAVSAAECGDGVCESGEGCVSCQADCGACDGAMCFIDSNCASNICCNGECGGSCLTFSQSEGLGGTGMFLSNPVNVVLFLGIVIVIVTGAIVYAIYFRKKPATSGAQVPKDAPVTQ